MSSETCPHCGADLRGDPIPEEHRERYPSGETHYSRTIGVEIRGVYDGVLFWLCPDCNFKWHRFDKRSPYRARAEKYVIN
jgi:hypothetical protein